jgi:hypothetical protein
MRRILFIFLGLCMLGGASPWAAAQTLTMTKAFIMSKTDNAKCEGILLPLEGETISKKKVVFKFQGVQDSEKRFCGYHYEASNLEALQKDDKIALFIHNIDLSQLSPLIPPCSPNAFKLASVSGGWREVTIESVSHEGDTVVIGFKKPLKLQSGEKLQSLKFTLHEGYLEEAPAAAVGE